MIDIHTHILPNLDDGSGDINTTIKMLEQEISTGVTDVVFTPHVVRGEFSSKEDILKCYMDCLEKFPKDIRYYLGSEIFYYKNMLNDIDKGNHITINNSKSFLMEFSMHSKPNDYEDFFYVAKLRGYKVVVAHPERYSYFDLNFIDTIRAYGGFVQVNSSSILGLHSKQAKKNAHILLKKGLVDFIASDSHNCSNRCPNLDVCYEYVNKKFGKDKANKIFIENKELFLSIIK